MDAQEKIKILETLERMKCRLGNPKNWIKGVLYDYDTEAVCLVGAARLVMFDGSIVGSANKSQSYRNLLEKLVTILNETEMGGYKNHKLSDLTLSLERYNDQVITTHADIMDLLDEAIFSIKKEIGHKAGLTGPSREVEIIPLEEHREYNPSETTPEPAKEETVTTTPEVEKEKVEAYA